MEVNTRVLHDSGDELMHEAMMIQHAAALLIDTRRRLWDLSGMDGIAYALKREERRLEQLSMTLRQMGITLEEISIRYERTERSVSDHLYNAYLVRPFNPYIHDNYYYVRRFDLFFFHSYRKSKPMLRYINVMFK